MVTRSSDLKIKIFADGASREEILEYYNVDHIAGFTTNPTLMKRAGITDYEAFAKDILSVMTDKPISFEVFSDEFDEMERQAEKIAQWGQNVYVKIPVTNTRSESSVDVIRNLTQKGVKLNVTAMMTLEQVQQVVPSLEGTEGAYVSVFAGRIADSGLDPLPIMKSVVSYLEPHEKIELIWASPREVLNIVQADEIGCDIITVTYDLLKKLPNIGKDLNEFSLDTVKLFYNDAQEAGYSI